VTEDLFLEEQFRHVHVSTQDMVAPFVARYYPGTLRRRLNSVFLRQEGKPEPLAVPATVVSSPEPQQYLPEEFLAACRDAVAFAERLAAGQVETPSDDLLALAKRAVQQQEARRGEDVDAWAERLARDVGNATD
jgi:hypothetical protein